MTYREFWQSMTAVYDESEARAVALMVLEKRFGLSMADVLCGKSGDEQELLLIQHRLLTGEPVQYVLGSAEFGGRQFFVEPGVLIPRPETYELCQWVLECLPADSKKTILDIGTGSGCIACTLAAERTETEVTGWDISEKALAVAQRNAHHTGVHLTLEVQDALNAPTDNNRWDIIVSNPPYICERERTGMERNVLDYEPSEALFVPDDNPLLFYRAIARYASKALKKGGCLFFEINALYAQETESMLLAEGFPIVETRRDLFGKERFIKATRP